MKLKHLPKVALQATKKLLSRTRWTRSRPTLRDIDARLATIEARILPGISQSSSSRASTFADFTPWVPVLLRTTQSIAKISQEVHEIKAQFAGVLPYNLSLTTEPTAPNNFAEVRLDTLESNVTRIDEKFRSLAPAIAYLQSRPTVEPDRSAEAADLVKIRKDMDFLRSQLPRLWQRIDYVRAELLLEQRYGSADDPVDLQEVQSKVINPEKLNGTSPGDLRLNIGCGHLTLEEFVNVDRRELPNVDIVADATKIPLGPSSVGEIYSAHLIEHFPLELFRRRVLPHWRTLLSPGGKLRLITPDGQAMLGGVADGTYSFDDFRAVLFGAQDYVGDFHFNLFTPESLTALLLEYGFRDIQVVAQGRRNGECFEFETVAFRDDKPVQSEL